MKTAGLPGFVSSRHLLALEKGPQRASGALLQMDISGFTALTEELGTRGKAGTETLTRILHRVFTPLLDLVYRHGGEVLQFQGDGLFAGFYDPDPSRARSRAGSCAGAMLDASREFQDIPTPWGTHVVRFRVTVQEGTWLEAVVGDAERTELLISGSSLVDLIRATAQAAPGSLWINGVPASPESCEPFLLPVRADAPQPVPAPSAFYPAGVERFLKASARGEHRVVSTVFVGLSGYDPDRPPLTVFQELFVRVREIVHRHGGALARLDPYAQGHRLLLLFGAPVARERSVLNAVRCAMDLARLDFPPFQIRASCTTGFVYAGVVGTPWRREFTVLGDAVNLASRLLDHAPERAPVVDETSYRLTRRHTVFQQGSPIPVRGRSRPVTPWIPIHRRGKDESPWVGREETVQRVLRWIRHHVHSVTVLRGEAGAGKSRLIQELLPVLEREGWSVLAGSIGEGSYPLMENMLRQLAGISSTDPEEIQKARLEEYLKIRGASPDLLRRSSFLSVMVLGLEMPESLYARVDPELRRENLMEAIEEIFLLESRGKGLVVVLDDLDRSTSEEVDLLREVFLRLVRNHPRTRLHILGSGRTLTPETLNLSASFPVLDLPLEGLSPEAVRVWCHTLLQNDPPEDLIAFLYERSRGIPLLLEEYLWFLLDQGYLIRDSFRGWEMDATAATRAIPENIWTLIMARVDRLSPPSRRTLKAGSVAGKVFPGAVVERVVSGAGTRSLLDAAREGILQPEETRAGWWAFRHALLQEVIYDSLLEEEKRAFHRGVGEALEALQPLPYRTLASLLAYHYDKGGLWDRALRHTLAAARFAREAFHTREARNLYRKALELLRRHRPEDRETLYEVLENLGVVNRIAGHLEEARACFEEMADRFPQAYRRARALQHLAHLEIEQARVEAARSLLSRALDLLEEAEATPPVAMERAGVLVLQARVAQIQRRLDEAHNFARQAMEILENLAGSPGISEQNRLRSLASALNLLTIIAIYRGAYSEALRFGHRGLEVAQACQDRLKESQFYGNLGLVYHDLGQWDRALEFLEKDWTLSEEIGHLQGLAAALSNIGIVHLQRGAFGEAREALTRALAIQRRLGLTRDEAKTLCNLGVVACQAGDYTEALSCFRRFGEMSRRIGYRAGEAAAWLNLGEVCFLMGDLERAETWLAQARPLLENLKDTYNLMDWHLIKGACFAARGVPEEARQHYLQALELARAQGVAFMEARALARLAGVCPDPAEARRYFQEALQKMEALEMRRERADTLIAWGTFLRKQGETGWKEAFQEAAGIYRNLGLPEKAREAEQHLSAPPE